MLTQQKLIDRHFVNKFATSQPEANNKERQAFYFEAAKPYGGVFNECIYVTSAGIVTRLSV